MEHNIFEAHLLGNKTLPFIFHSNLKVTTPANRDRTNWHPNIEFLYVLEGNGTVLCDSQEYRICKNDIFIVNSNMTHTIFSDRLIRYHCLIIDSGFCLANDIDSENITFKNLIKDNTAAELFLEAANEFSSQDTYKNSGIKSAVLRLLVYIARNYTNNREKSISGKKEHIKLVIGYIKSHSSKKLTLEDLAQQSGLSKYYFLREFKNTTGYTPMAYVNKIRCENAKKILLSGKYSIKEAGEYSGFENFSHFSKTFRLIEGVTPSQYQKKYLK